MNIFGEEERWINVENEVLTKYERGTLLIFRKTLLP
jgi:hypothetical protein